LKYSIDKKMIVESNGTVGAPDRSIVEVITRAEYKKLYGNHEYSQFFLKSMENYQYCKADVFRDCMVGTFVIPDKCDLTDEKEETCFAFYMDKKHLIFVDDTNFVNEAIRDMGQIQSMHRTQTAHFLFEFMEHLVKDDVQFLQDYEKRMAKLEESLIDEQDENTPRTILTIRKELLKLSAYYEQLIDMSNILKENHNHILNQEDCSLFMLFSDRVDRLADDTKNLRELALQILEMYQTQIDAKQNKVMQFLTVVTTVFTPLAFLSGWYGMNWSNIPELRNPNGYFILLGVCAAIVVACLWYFKKNKWL
jgi:Mg2+ and Co2+ transporters